MNKLFVITFLISLLSSHATAQSQWQQLNGPYGTSAVEMLNHNGDIFITTNTGQTAGGIYRTSDNGLTWIDVTGIVTGSYTRNFAEIGNDIFVGHDTSVFMSSNNGNTWTDVSSNLPDYHSTTVIGAFKNRLFALLYDGSNYDVFYYSDNNGSSWTASGYFVAVGTFRNFYADGDNFWAATTDGVMLSTDSGITWNTKSTNIPFNAMVIDIVAHGDTLYCGTSNGTYYSTDGADLWNLAIGGITQQTVGNCLVLSGDTVYMGTGSIGVYYTTLGDDNWTAVGTLPNYTYIYSITINNNELAIGLVDGFYAYPLPSGSWNLRVDGLQHAIIRAVYADGNTILAAIGNSRGVSYSGDGGNTWQPTTLGTGTFILSIEKIGSTYYALSPFNGLNTSPDGINWTFVSIPGLGSNCIVSTGNKLLLGTTGGLYEENGGNWIPTGSGLPPSSNVYDIAVSGIDVYVTVGGTVIYVSHDGGATFHEGNNGIPFSFQCNKLEAVDDYVLAFTLSAVYRSSDGGENFNMASGNYFGPPYATITSGKNIFAGTYDGVKVSDNLGKTWHDWSTGIPEWTGSTYCLGADAPFLYAGTETRGVWKRDFLPQIMTGTIGGAPFCAGGAITVSFNSVVTFNPGNKFYIELSDSAGHFADPLLVDSLLATVPAPVNTTLPINIAEGNYRIRVVASDPYVIIQDNGFDLSIGAVPAVTLQPAPQQTCVGNGATFYTGANGTGLTYQWQENNGSGFVSLTNNATYQDVNTNMLQIISATAFMDGYAYRCIVNGNCNPGDTSASAVLTVHAMPVVTLQPADSTVCDGASISFTATAIGTFVTYQWQVDNGIGFSNIGNFPPYTGANTQTLMITSAIATMNGNLYRCEITGCTNTQSALLTVNGTPVSPAIGASILVCAGGSVQLSRYVPGAGITYQWQEDSGTGFANISNGGNYAGADSAILTISNITVGMDGFQYQCIINGVCAPLTSVSTPSILSVNTNFPTINQQPVNTAACENSLAYFAVDASGGFVYFNWEMNDGSGWVPVPSIPPFSGTDQDTLFIDNVSTAMNNLQFRCIISTCTVSSAAALTVNANPSVSISQFPGLFCLNDPAVTLSGGFPSGGTYYGSGINGNQFIPSYAGVGDFNITYVYTDGNGCSNQASQVLTVEFCIGTGVSQPVSPATSWNVFPNPAVDQITIKGEQTDDFIVSVHSITGACLLKKELNGTNNSINVSELSNGFYLMLIRSDNMVVPKRIIIAR